MMTNVEQLVELAAGETEILGKNLPQCRFVHHKSHITRAAALGSRQLTV
jgi:hypothetical protein